MAHFRVASFVMKTESSPYKERKTEQRQHSACVSAVIISNLLYSLSSLVLVAFNSLEMGLDSYSLLTCKVADLY